MVKKIGVIGSAQMGAGVAHVAALSGYDVVMSDITIDRAESGLAVIAKNMDRQVKKEVISATDKDAAFGSSANEAIFSEGQ